jgi:hypothetical protein
MKYNINLDNMPEFVLNLYGQAQKTLTKFEGDARKTITSTYTIIKENPTIKNFGVTVDNYWNKYSDYIKVEPFWSNFEKIKSDLSLKAATTIGLATKTDIKAITSKLNQLTKEVKKIASYGKSKVVTKKA